MPYRRLWLDWTKCSPHSIVILSVPLFQEAACKHLRRIVRSRLERNLNCHRNPPRLPCGASLLLRPHYQRTADPPGPRRARERKRRFHHRLKVSPMVQRSRDRADEKRLSRIRQLENATFPPRPDGRSRTDSRIPSSVSTHQDRQPASAQSLVTKELNASIYVPNEPNG